MDTTSKLRTISAQDESERLAAIDRWIARSLKPEVVRAYDHAGTRRRSRATRA